MKVDSPALLHATGEADLNDIDFRLETTPDEVVPGEHTALDNADKLINNYVHQYLIERGYHQTANCFKDELPEEIASNIASQTADDANAGFLGDWWMLVQDLVPVVNSAREGRQTAQPDSEIAGEATSCRTPRPVSSSSGPASTCCKPTKQDRSDRPPASVDRLLALSIAQTQSGPQPQAHHQNEHAHISPQLLHRSPPVPRRIPIVPTASSPWDKASERGYRLQMPSVMDPIQTELARTLPPSFAQPSTPPSPTTQALAPAASGTKKRSRAKKQATDPPRTKAATASRPAKRRRSQTVAARSKAMSEEGGDEGASNADWCAGSPVSSNQSYDNRGSPANGRREKLDRQQDNCICGFEESTSTVHDDAADAALMAELARYAASCQPATPSHSRFRHDPASSSTTSNGLTASLWAHVAAQPGPDFAGLMTTSSSAQPSLMLLPDVTHLSAQREMSFLECDPFNAISSTSRSSHHQGSTVQDSGEGLRQPNPSGPWNPTETPVPVRNEATGSSASQLTIGVPLLSGQDSDLDLFPALRDQLLPVARKLKRYVDVPSAHDDDLPESHEPIYSYFNPAGETTSFQSATPTASNVTYREATSSTHLQTTAPTWEDYSEDEKPTQRLAHARTNFAAPLVGTNDPTTTPNRAYSASHVPRTDSRSSLPPSATPVRPATHSGPPQSRFTAKEAAPKTHHLSRRSVSYSIGKPAFPSYESTSPAHVHAHANQGDCSHAEGSVAKQKRNDQASPEKPGSSSSAGTYTKSGMTSSDTLFPLSLSSEDRSTSTNSTSITTTTTATSSSSPPLRPSQPPLGIPPHCIDFDAGAGMGAGAGVGKSRPVTEADRQMAMKLQRGMLAQEEAREKMAEYFRPKPKEAE